ncbi:MAG: sugar phosphate isomerase/epimerase [Chloroflexi bacterium]|nr:sugar phosphate isomerase/epimerase [Chloroflexota bacterium]
MQKGICFGSIPGSDAEERFRHAAAAGLQGIEVNTLHTLAEREQIMDLSKRYGLPVISVMNTDHWRYPLSDPDPTVVSRSLAGIEQSIETASFLGADTVLVVPAVVTPDVSYEQAWQRSTDAIRQVLPLAEKHQVTLAVENVWNKFLLSPVEFAAYVDAFASPFVGAYFDVGNILLYGYPHQWIHTLGTRILQVHVKGFDTQAFRFTYLREGSVDWPRVMAALRDIGYHGYITAELPIDQADPLGRLAQISADLDAILQMADA